MKDEKALELFEKVLDMTRKKILKWEATAEEGEYIASIGQGLVLKIWPFTEFGEDGDREGPPSMTLNDDKNSVLLDMTVNIDGIRIGEVTELSTLAKRISLNIDAKVDIALKQLGTLEDEDIPF